MSAQRLREAAKALREKTEAATPGPWEIRTDTPSMSGSAWSLRTAGMPGLRIVAHEYQHGPGNSDYIAMMHPGVGLALATLLDETAERWDLLGDPSWSADEVAEFTALADLILGGTS